MLNLFISKMRSLRNFIVSIAIDKLPQVPQVPSLLLPARPGGHSFTLTTKGHFNPFTSKWLGRAQENDDVCFWWRTLCSTVEVDSNTAEALLPQITEHYIIVRGFAFAARWMEAYKCKRKKMSRSLKDLKKPPII